MPAECRSVLKSCLAQFVKLDACGNPVTGAASRITTKGYISVAPTAQIEDGAEILLKNACGELCINEKDEDLFKRFDLEIQLCEIDPELLSLIGGSRLLVDGDGDTRGFAYGESSAVSNFSLELWNKVAAGECAGDPDWFYVAYPFVHSGLMTNWTHEDGPLTLTIKAHTKGAGSLWGQGPSCVLPVESPAIAGDHVLGYITNVQPPTPQCGLQALDTLVCA